MSVRALYDRLCEARDDRYHHGGFVPYVSFRLNSEPNMGMMLRNAMGDNLGEFVKNGPWQTAEIFDRDTLISKIEEIKAGMGY